MLKIRLARYGAKKRPHYRIVVADVRSPRDGRFLETVGTYSPMLSKDSDQRVVLQKDRIDHWIRQGAQPTDRVSIFLEKEGLRPIRERKNPIKGRPRAKAQERLAEAAQKEAELAAAASDEQAKSEGSAEANA